MRSSKQSYDIYKIDTIFKRLEFLQNSSVLDLSGLYLNDDDVEMIAKLINSSNIYNHYSIRELDLRRNDFSQAGVDQLQKALQIKTINIKYVDQDCNAHLFHIDDDVKQEISTHLNLENVASLAGVCSNFYTLFKPNLQTIGLIQLLQAVIDDERDTVISLLDKNPRLLIVEPPKNLILESKLTWQKFYAEKPLAIATKRGQLSMVKLLLPYFEELEQLDIIEDGKKEALVQWRIPEINENEREKYNNKVKELIDFFKQETFSKGTDKDRLIERISEKTKDKLNEFREDIRSHDAIRLDSFIDPAQFLMIAHENCATLKTSCTDIQRDSICVSVFGFLQSVMNPELAKILCYRLYWVANNDVTSLLILGDQACSLYLPARSQKLLNKKTFFYHKECDSLSGLGFDYVIDSFGIACNNFSYMGFSMEDNFKKIIQARMSELNRLNAELKNGNWPHRGEEQSLCVMQ